MNIFCCIRNGAIGFLMASVFASLPVSAQNTWMNPFTGNSFNNPISSTLDTTILFSMQRRLTQSQLLGTLPSQRGRTPPPVYQSAQPQPQGAAPSASAPTPASAPQHYPISATDFTSGQRVLPAAYAAKGPKENQAQLLQTFNGMMDAFEKEGRKNNVAYAIGFLIGASAQVHTGREVSDTVLEKFVYDLNDILAGSPNFQTLPPNKKQELYESSVLMGAMIAGLATDPGTKADSKSLAKQVLQSVGAIN